MRMKSYLHYVSLESLRGICICLGIAYAGIIFESCGNPVVPTGGPKDTTSPEIVDIRIKKGSDLTNIAVLFNENISGKGNAVTTPKTLKQKPNNQVHRKQLTIEVPNYTQHIFLNGYIVDLNENNAYLGKNISFDSTKYHLQCKINEKGGKDKFQLFIKEDSLYHVPLFYKNQYQFEGLPDTQFVLSVIKNDNNNFQVDESEEYNSIRINRKFRYSDTLDISMYPKIKAVEKIVYDSLGNFIFYGYKPLLDRDNPGITALNDTGYAHVDIDQAAIFIEQIQDYYSGYCDSLPIIRNKKSLALISNKRLLSIESRYIENKDTFTLVADTFQGSNKTLSSHPFTIKNGSTLPYRYSIIPSKKKNVIVLGKVELVNEDSITQYLYIYNNKSGFITSVSGRSKQIFILPNGKYQILHWIKREGLNSRETNNKYLLELPNQTNEYQGSLFYRNEKDIVVDNNIENTLILPKKMLFNTGIIFR